MLELSRSDEGRFGTLHDLLSRKDRFDRKREVGRMNELQHTPRIVTYDWVDRKHAVSTDSRKARTQHSVQCQPSLPLMAVPLPNGDGWYIDKIIPRQPSPSGA